MDMQQFQRELASLGGLNPRGEPNLKIVRCDQETTFAYGRTIPKYFIPGGATPIREKRFRLRRIFTNELKDCTFDEAKEVWERSQEYDLTNHYIAETFEIRRNDPTPREGYFVEQYIPPDKIKDTPENWERNRFGMWFDEALEREVWVDKIGPFPFQGRYEGFIYARELSGEVLDTVREAWVARERWKQPKSDELMVKDVFQEAKNREMKTEAETKDMLVSEMKPHAFRGFYMGQGDPQKMNKITKHGRAR
jgi:hypothetical protein